MAPEQTISLRAEVAQQQRQHSKRASKSTSQRARSSPSHGVVEHRQGHEGAEVGEATPRKREGTRRSKKVKPAKELEAVQAISP